MQLYTLSWLVLPLISTPFSLPYLWCWEGTPWTSYLVILLQTLPWNSHWPWNQNKAWQQFRICFDHCLSHRPNLLLIIFLCSSICQSVCIHWVCLISFYNVNSLEQRFFVGFTIRFSKYNNNYNNSKESERRLAQHVSPTNRRFIVSVVLFITRTPLTERVCCHHRRPVFSISQHETSLEICLMNRILSLQLKRRQYSL